MRRERTRKEKKAEEGKKREQEKKKAIKKEEKERGKKTIKKPRMKSMSVCPGEERGKRWHKNATRGVLLLEGVVHAQRGLQHLLHCRFLSFLACCRYCLCRSLLLHHLPIMPRLLRHKNHLLWRGGRRSPLPCRG